MDPILALNDPAPATEDTKIAADTARGVPSEHRSAPSAEVEGFLDPCAMDLCITPCLDAGNVFVAPDGCHYVGETVTFQYRDVGK